MDSAGIPWYSTGTVNVKQGSTNVAGVGTNWANAGLKVGDIFTIDKSRLYQIAAINSNTSLSLQEAYQGATGSSQVYFVIRNFAGTMQAQIAAQVSELVNKYESYIDTELKQITGPAGPTSFPYRGTWTTGRTYNGLDVVQYGNQLYMALYGHTSTSTNAPAAANTAWDGLKINLDVVRNGSRGNSKFTDAFFQKALIDNVDVGGIDLVGDDENGEIKRRFVRFLPHKQQMHFTHYDGDQWTTDAVFSANSDTGWLQFKSSDDQEMFKYRKKNGFVSVYVGQKLTLAAGNNEIGILPEGFRGLNGIETALTRGSQLFGVLRIDSSGRVRVIVPNSASGSWVNAFVTFPV